MNTLKTCSICDEKKTLKNFYVCMDKGHAKYKSECKECTKKRLRRKYFVKANRKRIAGTPEYQAYQRAYYAANKKKFHDYYKGFRERHPEYYKDIYWRNKKRRDDARDALKDRDIA